MLSMAKMLLFIQYQTVYGLTFELTKDSLEKYFQVVSGLQSKGPIFYCWQNYVKINVQSGRGLQYQIMLLSWRNSEADGEANQIFKETMVQWESEM